MVNHILTVRGRKASVTPRTLVQGTVGQDTLTLDLDSEWNGLNVTVTFVAATTEITPVLNANVCEIPHEALVDSGEVDVFVLGTRDGKAMRHASLEHKMVVKKSNMSDGSNTADPSISAYRQAYDDAVKATEAANSAAGDAGSTAVEMEKLNKRYETQISQQDNAFSTDQIQRANDFSTAQTQRAHDFDSAMQGYENAFNEAEGERAAAETERVKVEKERVKAEEKRAQDSKTRLEELAQAKTNAETATGEANTARDEAKKAATDATSAAGKATDAAGLAETAKTNANTAAGEAKSAATKAETAARKADGAAETAGTAASTAAGAANKADTAAGNAESMAEKADASANKADIAAGKANEATVAATNAATKANEVEAKLTGNVLKGKTNDTFIHVDDAFPSTLLGIEIEGACKQDGTPSPDNPVPIEVVENPVLKVQGRNFVEVTNISDNKDEYSGVLFVEADIKPSENYILSFDVDKAGNRYCLNESLFTYIDFDVKKGRNYIQCNTVSNISKSNIAQYSHTPKGWTLLKNSRAQKNDVQFSNVQLERGSIVSDYVPYAGTSQSFTLPPEHPYIAKLPGDTADEIVVDKDGNVELVARVGKLDTSNIQTPTRIEAIANGLTRYEYTSFVIPPAAVASVAITPNFKPVIDFMFNEEGCYVSGKTLFVGTTSDPTETIRASGYLYYDLAEPVTYNLGKIELPTLPESTSNVWTDAEVTPRTGIEYTRDVNIVVENLESAIASIS